ncbi:MAG TPA: hypothetical protein VLS47_00680, partial [Gallionella sp.]|nr:hypothetical protein [Gallionella sp.]
MRQNGYKMARDNGNKSSSPRKGGNLIWTGILAGILIGVGMAAGVAWYLMKTPSPFVNKEQPALARPQPDPAKSPAATGKPPATGDGKQRFEFYKMLTDKQGATVVAPARPADRTPPARSA